MAKIKEEDLRLNIIVNGDKGQKKLLELRDHITAYTTKVKQLRLEREALDKSSEKYAEKEKDLTDKIQKSEARLKSYNEEYKKTIAGMDLATMTMGQLQAKAKGLRTALREAVPGTEQWQRLNKELGETKSRIAEVNSQVMEAKGTLGSFAKSANSYMAAIVSVYVAVDKVTGGIRQAEEAFMRYDESLTDAVKTTGRTKDEIRDISDELSKVDTKTAQNDLLSLVRAGGKLGISAHEDLIGFAKAADKINVALAEDLGGNAEAAITAIGKMTDIFNLTEEFGIEAAMLKTASAINDLGMASTASEGYIVDFSKRLAGIAPNADISISKVLGLAATLDKYGQQAETASTAVGQTITAMFKRTDVFARVAGMAVKDFSELLAVDVNEAFIRVLEGMNRGRGGLSSITAAMEEMKLNGQRAATVLGALAKNSGELRFQQTLAAEAFDAGTSIMEEFNTKNTSATAVMEKQKKAILAQKAALGEQLMPVQVLYNSAVEKFYGSVAKVIGLALKYKATLISLAATYVLAKNAQAAWLTVKRLFHFWSRASRIELGRETAQLVAHVKLTGQAKVSALLFAAAQNLLAGRIKYTVKALKALSYAFKLNPVGAVTAGVGALVTVFTFLWKLFQKNKKAAEEASKAQRGVRDAYIEATAQINKEKSALDKLGEAVFKAKKGSQERAAAINAINERYGEYLPNLLTEKSSNEDVARALHHVNLQLANKIRLQARENEEASIFENLTNSVKGATDSLGRLYKKWNWINSDISAEGWQKITEAVQKYKETLLSGDDGKSALKTLNADLAAAGFDLKEQALYGTGGGLFHKNKSKLIEDAMSDVSDAVSSTIRRKAMLDGIFGKAEDLTADMNFSGAPASGQNTAADSDKGKKTWSLSSDREYLAAKSALTKKYNEGEIKDKEQFEQLLHELEISAYKSRLASGADSADERVKIEAEMQEAIRRRDEAVLKKQEETNKQSEALAKEGAEIIASVEKDKIKAAEAAEALRYEEEKKKFSEQKISYENQAAVLEAIELKHQNNMRKIRLEAGNKKIADFEREHNLAREEIKRKYSEEISKLKPGNAGVIASKKRGMEYDLISEDLKYLEDLKKELERITDKSGDFALNLPEEELHKYLLQLEQTKTKIAELTTAKKREDAGVFSGLGGGSLFGVSQEDWQRFFTQAETAREKAEKLGTALNAIGGLAQQGFQLAAQAISLTNAKENAAFKEYQKNNEKKKKSLKDRLNAGLMSEAQYNAEVEAMQEEEAAKNEEMQIKQAERKKKMDIVQAIINTALGVTKTLAEWGVPLGIAPAAIMAAMGAAQVAMIAAQPVTGAEEGGFVETTRAQDGKRFKARLSPDKRGFVSAPTVLVGESGGEYVIPADGLENPSLLPFIRTIESARRSGTLRKLNFEAVYPVSSIVGRASGGFTGEAESARPLPPAVERPAGDERLLYAIERLNKILGSPIRAEVSMLGKNGIIEQTEKYNRAKNRGNL